MSCREHDEAIVELARGADLEPERLRGVREHLAHCAACRCRFEREEALTAGLGALSRRVALTRPSADLESRLLDAFHAASAAPAASATATAHQSVSAKATARQGAAAKTTARWVGLAAAAAIVLAVIPAWLLEPPPKPQPPVPKRASNAQEAPVVRQPAIAVASVPAVTPTTRAATTRSPRKATAADGVLRPAGFVALPGVAGLPAFESGVIARIEIPLTSLPNYGIPIAPDAARTTVPADILVGQDGLARAIRLVRTSTTIVTTRSTQ